MLVALTRATAGLFGRGGVGGLATPVMGTEGAEPALEECQVGGRSHLRQREKPEVMNGSLSDTVIWSHP